MSGQIKPTELSVGVCGLPRLRWVPSPNFSGRTAPIDLIVIHDCEGWYEGSIATFQNTHSQVSAHLVMNKEGAEATQMVRFANKAWHAVAFNSRAIGIEQEGFEKLGLPDVEWNATARVTAYLCKRFGIPPVWSQNGGPEPGIARHVDLGRAGGGHQDPTLDLAVWEKFLARVKTEYDKGGFPSQPWGH